MERSWGRDPTAYEFTHTCTFICMQIDANFSLAVGSHLKCQQVSSTGAGILLDIGCHLAWHKAFYTNAIPSHSCIHEVWWQLDISRDQPLVKLAPEGADILEGERKLFSRDLAAWNVKTFFSNCSHQQASILPSWQTFLSRALLCLRWHYTKTKSM